VFDAAATHGRLSWSDFAGRLLNAGGGGIQDGFEPDGPLKGISPRDKKRLVDRAKNQKAIRAVGGAGFRKIFQTTIQVRSFTQPMLEKVLRDHDTDNDGYLTVDELALAVRHLGIHDVCSSDFRAFADFAAPAHKGQTIPPISISHLVDIGFAIEQKACKQRGNFYLGGGSRNHGRDRAVPPRGLHEGLMFYAIFRYWENGAIVSARSRLLGFRRSNCPKRGVRFAQKDSIYAHELPRHI
jgi:hypothetical protein